MWTFDRQGMMGHFYSTVEEDKVFSSMFSRTGLNIWNSKKRKSTIPTFSPFLNSGFYVAYDRWLTEV